MAEGFTTIGALCEEGLAHVQTGPFGSQLHSYDYVASGVPVVPTEAIRDRRIDHTVCPQISASKAEELARHRLRKGDILFARRGVQATGHIGVVREQEEGFLCGTGAILLRVKENNLKLDWEFLSHLLANPKSVEWFKFHAIGATMPNLNEGIIRSFPLQLPALPIQKAIASFLSALDDKIELNRRMNETLEAMARAIFKDWFVDFSPTRAKMEGSAPYLASDIWALFPDRMNQDGVPDGFTIQELSTVTSELRRGISPKYLHEGGVRVLNQKCVRDRSILLTPARRHDSIARKIDGRELSPGDILVNSTGVGTLGRTAQIWWLDQPTIVDSHVTVVRASSTMSALYLGFNLTGRESEIEALGEGSTGQTELSRKRLAEISITVPPIGIMREFDKVAQPFVDRIEANRLESSTLAATRDLLLPKLMSGEIRIRDAQAMVADAA